MQLMQHTDISCLRYILQFLVTSVHYSRNTKQQCVYCGCLVFSALTESQTEIHVKKKKKKEKATLKCLIWCCRHLIKCPSQHSDALHCWRCCYSASLWICSRVDGFLSSTHTTLKLKSASTAVRVHLHTVQRRVKDIKQFLMGSYSTFQVNTRRVLAAVCDQFRCSGGSKPVDFIDGSTEVGHAAQLVCKSNQLGKKVLTSGHNFQNKTVLLPWCMKS